MKQFGYIINSAGTLIERFRLNTARASEFEKILEQSLSDYPTKTFHSITNSSNLKTLTEERIKYYLGIRNNEKPDYGVDWEGRFTESEMFNSVNVLGNKMRLFHGNEDNIISFLANIYNQVSYTDEGISWILVNNDLEFRELNKST